MGEFSDFKPGPMVGDVPAAAPLGAAPPVSAQSPSTVTSADVIRIAKEEGLDPARALAHWQQESSGGKNTKTSVDGAHGGFQILPATFKSVYPEGDIDNPHDNARGGIRFLKKIADRFPGNPEAQAASYFTGPDRVARYGGDVSKMAHIKDGYGVSVPEYAAGVMKHYDRFKSQLPVDSGAVPPAAASA